MTDVIDDEYITEPTNVKAASAVLSVTTDVTVEPSEPRTERFCPVNESTYEMPALKVTPAAAMARLYGATEESGVPGLKRLTITPAVSASSAAPEPRFCSIKRVPISTLVMPVPMSASCGMDAVSPT